MEFPRPEMAMLAYESKHQSMLLINNFFKNGWGRIRTADLQTRRLVLYPHLHGGLTLSGLHGRRVKRGFLIFHT